MARALGDGVRMTDETYEAILAAIREDAEAMLSSREHVRQDEVHEPPRR